MSAFVLKFRAVALHTNTRNVNIIRAHNVAKRLNWHVTNNAIGRINRQYSVDASTGQAVAAADVHIYDRLQHLLNEEQRAGKVVPVFKKALYHADRIAIKDENGEYTYHQIYSGAKRLSEEISQLCGKLF